MPAPALVYSLSNGNTADAAEVMANFNALLNGITDGTKDLSISALTCAGTATFNGNTTLGNASSDDLTITASLASSLAVKTTNSFTIGGSSTRLAQIYSVLGNFTTLTAAAVNLGETDLNHYEEGAMSALTISTGDNCTSQTGATSGTYTRIGRIVVCTLSVPAIVPTTAATFAVTFPASELPFAPISAIGLGGSGGAADSTTHTGVVMLRTSSTDTVALRGVTVTTTTSREWLWCFTYTI